MLQCQKTRTPALKFMMPNDNSLQELVPGKKGLHRKILSQENKTE